MHGYHVHDNGIENSKYGLYIEHGENDLIQNNRFYSLAAAGIYLVSSKFLQIEKVGAERITFDWMSQSECSRR